MRLVRKNQTPAKGALTYTPSEKGDYFNRPQRWSYQEEYDNNPYISLVNGRAGKNIHFNFHRLGQDISNGYYNVLGKIFGEDYAQNARTEAQAQDVGATSWVDTKGREHIIPMMYSVSLPIAGIGSLGTVGDGMQTLNKIKNIRASVQANNTGAIIEGFEGITVPKGFSPLRVQNLRNQNGIRTVHLVKDNNTGKVKILEDLQTPTVVTKYVDLKNYKGEPLTGKEPGFDEWALKQTPESDHFPDLSHGLEKPTEIFPIIQAEFDALPNGARVSLGETFSGDTSPLILQNAYKHRDRIRLVLPSDPDAVVKTNSYGIRGKQMAERFNQQLERLLEVNGYSPTAVKQAVYNEVDNTLSVPDISFIKLHKYGGKIE